MNRLVVAFDNDSTISRVKEMLSSSSLQVRSFHRTGAEVIRAVRFMGGGTVVCGTKLSDMTADQLCDDLEGIAHLLVIGKPLQLEMCESADIFKLPLPINRYDLTASVKMLLQLEEMSMRRKNNRNDRDNQAIAYAKQLLGQTFGMSEAEAHHYLQKRSMDAGIRITDTAAMIIDSYAKGK